ncbi:MFS transporter [Campylobacterota bacterium]|nr:MFS transporter [Campylobacterota bacterium]
MKPHTLTLKLVLWLLAALTMLSGAAIAASLPGIAAHFVDLENSEILSRMILTLPALTIALIAPIAGVLVHRFGRIMPMYFALVLYAAAGTTGLFADSIWTMLLGRMGLGAAVAVLMTAGTTLTGDYFQGRERDRFLSLQGAFVTLGGVFFLTGGGVLSDFSWRAPFGVYFVSLLLIPLVAIALYEPKTHAAHKESMFGEGGYVAALPVFAVAFFTMAIFYIVPTQLPFVVMDHMGGSGREAGFVMGTGPLFGAIGALGYARLRRYISLRSVYIVICISQGVGLGTIGLASEIWQLYLPLVFVGFGSGLAMANTQSWFLDLVAEAKRAKLSGILTGSFFFGQFSSPLVVHPFLAFMPLHYVFTLFGSFLLVAAAVLAITHKRSASY